VFLYDFQIHDALRCVLSWTHYRLDIRRRHDGSARCDRGRSRKGAGADRIVFKSLSPGELRAQVYKDGAHWKVQQVLAHFIAIERSMQLKTRDFSRWSK
jgi:hypothetical protein